MPESVFNVSVSYCDFDYLEGVDDVSLRPGSSKQNRSEAQKAAVGEVIERYAKYYPHETVSEEVKDEKYLWLEEEEAIRTDFEPLELGQKVEHVTGKLLGNGEIKKIPAQYVISNVDEAQNYGYAFSVGMATAHTVEQGVRKGIKEQLERDLAIKAWYEPEALVKIKADEFSSINFDADVFLVKNGFDAPMVLAVSYINEIPCFSFGLENTIEESVDEALIENIQVSSNVRGELIQGSNPFPESARKSVVEQRFPDKSSTLGRTSNDLVEKVVGNFNPVAFDLTPSDIENEGFKVTKVIIPEFRQFSRPELMYTGNRRFKHYDGPIPPFFHY